MMKKGHKRKNWTERWFVLKPNCISYYVGEDLTEKKGDILLDGSCTVEARDGCFYSTSAAVNKISVENLEKLLDILNCANIAFSC